MRTEAAASDFWPGRWHHRAALILVLGLAAGFRAAGLLTVFPIWIDEAIYLRWAEIIHHQGGWFVSLLDGKTPLSFWIYAVLRMIWDGDPLVAARSVSVAAGTAATLFVFAIGRRLAGDTAAIVGALLYAVLPYGVVYDRLAYTDALVNLAGLVITYTTLACFQVAVPSARLATATGLLLGLGYFCKPTALLFTPVPALFAVWGRRAGARLVIGRLALVYAVALVFPVLCWLSIPDAPTADINHVILHHTTFFTPITTLLADPLINARTNLDLLAGYLGHYVGVPLVVASLACLVVVARRHARISALLVLAGLIPIAFQVVVLQWFPSRYVFPHVWGVLLIVAAGVAPPAGEPRLGRRWLPAFALVVVVAATAGQSVALLADPMRYLHPHDAEEHFGSGPFSGIGVRQAVDFLAAQASDGAFALLTDPVWGLPADAMYPYLNQRAGIRVFDAWWLQLSEDHPIVPKGKRAVMKSQYERVAAEIVDFARLPRVYYVTATSYQRPADVLRREPDAQLVARFARPNGTDSVDVYRLR